MDILFKEKAAVTPDPEQSLKGLERLRLRIPSILENYPDHIDNIARLFAYSRFLTDFAINHPVNLEQALKKINEPIARDTVIREAISRGFIVPINASPVAEGLMIEKNLTAIKRSLPHTIKQDAMRLLREIKKHYLLRITLRDLTGITDLNGCMAELSDLADAIVGLALVTAYSIINERFGDLPDNPFSIIALGKLGARELNYSSDIDIVTVYGSEEGVSTGVISSNGVITNRISAHEYYCRLTELLSSLLQQQTADGIAYRVDLRLRPDGRRGELSLSLDSYATYYESWGRTWERMALIRARHIAGDSSLGKSFMRAIEPFVWKKTADFYDIDEIRELKKKIDTVFDANDIKRGYGGIREIEFFVQTFQLLYGGELKNLRTGKLEVALDELLKEGFLTVDDVKTLSGNYQFLRRLEHILQMKDDTQTHSLPTQPHDIEILSKKLQFASEDAFRSELKLRRLMVRDMYNSLLGAADDAQQEAAIFLEDDLTDSEIRDYLAYKGFSDPGAALQNINALNEQVSFGKTTRERTILRKTIPLFLEKILKSENKDKVLSMFITFIQKTGNHESYMDLFSERPDTVELVINTFAKSSYLTRSMLGLDNLESIFEYPDFRVDYKSVKERLSGILAYSRNPMDSLREFRVIEEMRVGLLFLEKSIEIDRYSNKLGKLADVILRTVLTHIGAQSGLAVIALGKFGQGELNIGSDLDLVFVSSAKSIGGASRTAGELIKFLSKYTSKGFMYEVDMRLRPDGSKGILVNDINGYRRYYDKAAHPWEIQALLRARPVAGDKALLREFHEMKKQVISKRGGEITGAEIQSMRKRIIKEVSKEAIGYDFKLGPGSVEEIEFLVQYLQLRNAATHPGLITHKTLTAMRRLTGNGILNNETEARLLGAYRFLRTVDTLLRLNKENVLKTDSYLVDIIVRFLGLKTQDKLVDRIEGTRAQVLEICNKYY